MLHLVDAEDPIVADLLLGTIELVLQSGGWVHPGARFVERSGHLSVHLTTDDERPLLQIPREAFVRVDAITWNHDADRLEVLDLPDDLGDAELPMLYLQTALHNQCGKLPWLREHHPAVAALPAHIVDAVVRIEPGFRRTTMSTTDLLFSNRCFRLALADDLDPQRVLIPLIDLLNHHGAGATAQWDGSAFDLMPSRPFGTTECALDYGLRRDAIEMALVYGFLDESATWVHSAPIDTQVDGVGRVIVTRDHRLADGSLVSMSIEHAPHTTRINRLTFEDIDALVDELVTASQWSRDQARAVAQALRHENRQVLSTLRDATQAEPDHQSASLISRAAEHSFSLL